MVSKEVGERSVSATPRQQHHLAEGHLKATDWSWEVNTKDISEAVESVVKLRGLS